MNRSNGQEKSKKPKKDTITIEFSSYKVTVGLLFCCLYPMLMGMTALLRVGVHTPAVVLPILLFAIARKISRVEQEDEKDAFYVKIGKLRYPMKLFTFWLPSFLMMVNFSIYIERSPYYFVAESVLFTCFYFAMSVSKKAARKLVKPGFYLIGLVPLFAGLALTFLSLSDLAFGLSLLCLLYYFGGLFMLLTKQITIKKTALMELIRSFFRYLRGLMRTLGGVMSPKQGFLKILQMITRKNQRKNLEKDDVIEDVQEAAYEDIGAQRIKYSFKHLHRIADLIRKIRYAYGYVLHNMEEMGVTDIKSTETPKELQIRLLREYEKMEQFEPFFGSLEHMTRLYEHARYGERIMSEQAVQQMEPNVKQLVKMMKPIVRKRYKD